MTDPGGGYGWRSGRHLPRRRGGVFGSGRLADATRDRFDDERPLAVLLLPVAARASSCASAPRTS